MNRRERRRLAKQQKKGPQDGPGDQRADSFFRMGRERDRAGDGEGAIVDYRKAVAIDPGHADAWMELGLVLFRLEQLDDAMEALRRAVLAKPDYALAYYNFGCVLDRAGHADKACDVYEEAVRLKPDFIEAGHAMAGSCKRLNDFDGAVKHYRRAIAKAKAKATGRDFVPAHEGLANTLRELGHTDEARQEFDRAMALDPDNAGIRVKAALVLPVIAQSTGEIANARKAYADNVADLLAGGISLGDPYNEVGMTNFYLAYHEQDDRPLQEAVAAMFLETCPALSWTASHCEAPLKKRKRLKIGICSAFMRDHTLGKQTLGVIKTLSRKRFEVFLFRLPGAEDEQSKAIDAAAESCTDADEFGHGTRCHRRGEAGYPVLSRYRHGPVHLFP